MVRLDANGRVAGYAKGLPTTDGRTAGRSQVAGAFMAAKRASCDLLLRHLFANSKPLSTPLQNVTSE
jgi:hypothetical protein